MSFSGEQPTLKETKIAKNYLNEKELRAIGRLVSGYLDFVERQAEWEIPMTNGRLGKASGRDFDFRIVAVGFLLFGRKLLSFKKYQINRKNVTIIKLQRISFAYICFGQM